MTLKVPEITIGTPGVRASPSPMLSMCTIKLARREGRPLIKRSARAGFKRCPHDSCSQVFFKSSQFSPVVLTINAHIHCSGLPFSGMASSSMPSVSLVFSRLKKSAPRPVKRPMTMVGIWRMALKSGVAVLATVHQVPAVNTVRVTASAVSKSALSTRMPLFQEGF
ncbi:hypothetical protein Lgee_2136 [Legionella geestiana]|uniref:Uncharacterized protein n=1 Tax=Legionella geestiana TaxID=45065 RepID=A0A0W0TMI7_9GAMM|nr:hypothetical protein Lgee_2136 [Legionella geestiana]